MRSSRLWALALSLVICSSLLADAKPLPVKGQLLTITKKDSALIGSWSIVELRDDDLNQNSRLGLPPQTDGKDPKRRVVITFYEDGKVTVLDAQGKRADGFISFTDFAAARTDPDRAPKRIDLTAHRASKDADGPVIYPGIYKIEGQELTLVWCEEDFKNSAVPTEFKSNGLMNLIRAIRIEESETKGGK
ncbi:MAG: hypothetical protein JNM56_21380 [Planctomycetia bacterium]|nr:hypothetical protein [Planctomycetia bacterium]